MTPYYQDSAVTIYHGDCREIVPTLGRFDLLLTDPPSSRRELRWNGQLASLFWGNTSGLTNWTRNAGGTKGRSATTAGSCAN